MRLHPKFKQVSLFVSHRIDTRDEYSTRTKTNEKVNDANNADEMRHEALSRINLRSSIIVPRVTFHREFLRGAIARAREREIESSARDTRGISFGVSSRREHRVKPRSDRSFEPSLVRVVRWRVIDCARALSSDRDILFDSFPDSLGFPFTFHRSFSPFEPFLRHLISPSLANRNDTILLKWIVEPCSTDRVAN